MNQILAVATSKGGTGKTTTCAALAQAAAAAGQKALVVDLDPQGNASFILAADQNQPGSYELLHGTPAAQLIQQTPQGLAVIAGGPDLATEKTTPGSAKRLQAALTPIRQDYDLIIIDTAPTLGELTYNALQAATGLLIPLETDSNSLQGLFQIAGIAFQMQRSNPALTVKGTILTRYDSRPKINRYLQEVIAEKGQEIGAPYLMGIRPGVAIREAQALQLSLYEYAPRSKPAEDYRTLYEMIQEG